MKRVYKTPLMKSEPVEKKVGIEDLQPDLAASVGDYTTRSGDASSVEMNFSQDDTDSASSVVMNFNQGGRSSQGLSELLNRLGITTIEELAEIIEGGGGGINIHGGTDIVYCGKVTLKNYAYGERHAIPGESLFWYDEEEATRTTIRMWKYIYNSPLIVKGLWETSTASFTSFISAVEDYMESQGISVIPDELKCEEPPIKMNTEMSIATDDYELYPICVEVPPPTSLVAGAGMIMLEIQAFVEGSGGRTVVPLPDGLEAEITHEYFDYTWASEYVSSAMTSHSAGGGNVCVHCFDSEGRNKMYRYPNGDPSLAGGEYRQCLLIINDGAMPAKVHITFKAYPQLSNVLKAIGNHIYSDADGKLFGDIPDYRTYRHNTFGV